MTNYTMESEINFIKLIISVPAGIEPATLRLTAARSNQLSYETVLQSAFNLRALPLSYGAMKTFVAPAGFDPATTSEMNGME